MIAENGYRYYSTDQVMIFEIINTLKAIGMSLKEIQEYSPRQCTPDFLELLKVKQSELLEAQRRLSATREFVDMTIGVIETSLHVDLDKLYREQCDEEYMVITDTPSRDDYINDISYWSKIEELTALCTQNHLSNVFPIGEIVLKENFERCHFQSDYYCSKPVRNISGRNIWRKPAGKYAVMYHRGSYKSLAGAYRQLKDHIDRSKLKLLGDIYEQDQLYLFSKSNPYDYLMKLSVAVEE